MAEDFFREEYVLNNTIGNQHLLTHISGLDTTLNKMNQIRVSNTVSSRVLSVYISVSLGTFKKPYIALIDGITMGGVSISILCG